MIDDATEIWNKNVIAHPQPTRHINCMLCGLKTCARCHNVLQLAKLKQLYV